MKLAERIFNRNDYYITSPFGWRIHPVSKKKSHHNGCDYGTHVKNWPQYPLEDGTVIAIHTGSKDKDPNGGYGNYVKIKYPRLGIQTMHAHLKTVNVKNGQAVNHETIIGTTGMTGNSTGVHLHLGLQNIGSSTWLDPELYDYKEGETMPFKVGDFVYAKEDIKLYTTIEYKESKTTLKKDQKAYVRSIKGNNVALADPETKQYWPSAWTNQLDKLTKDEPSTDYKQKYEEEKAKNEVLTKENDALKVTINNLNSKIKKAIEDLS